MFTASENESLILNYLSLPIWLACKSQIWIYSNFHLQRKCCQKWCSHEKSQLIFLRITNSNMCNFYCLIWLRFLSIDVSLNHNIQRNTNFHFSFYFDWDLLSIDVFLNHNIQIDTSFHFSFLFQLRFLSIDLFLNL